MNKPSHDKVLSTYLGTEVWSHTTRLAGQTRYQAVCVRCGKGLCDIEFNETVIEDSALGRRTMVHAILDRVEKNRCGCDIIAPEFDAAQAAPLHPYSKNGVAYIGYAGKLVVA